MCDCRPQVAGQQQFRFTPAPAADGVSLNSRGHAARDLSEPASIHLGAATALDFPTVSISCGPTAYGLSSTSNARALNDRRLYSVAVRQSGLSGISRLEKTPVDRSNLAVPFSLYCPAFPHSGPFVERFADNEPYAGKLQKSDEQQPVGHMRPTGSGLLGNVASVDRTRLSRPCKLQEPTRCRRKVVHEEGNADQCPPTGGKPDRHC